MTMSFDEAVAAVTAPGQMFSVVETEVLGRPTKVYENALPSLRSLFDMARTRDGVFLVYEDERLEFAEVMAQVDAIASMLVEHYGVKKGDRVAIGMRNYPEWITSFAAITSIGAIVVSLNAWWTT
ncbi:MAG: AMP-binding protein, partial [Acidimicrobiales bacterium]